jgi:adenosylhomocysteine nucleosidase
LGDVGPGGVLPARIGIVTGIAAEARIARRLTDSVACSGGDPERAAEQALALVAGGADALMSFGIAGGLSSDLAPGSLILASEIITDEGRYAADAVLAATLTRSPMAIDLSHQGRGNEMHDPRTLTPSPLMGGGRGEGGTVTIGVIYGGEMIISSIIDKAALAARTGALAVDLESGPVARVAAEAGIPFIALRAIADPAWRGLPEAALLPLDAEGRPRLSAVFGSIAKRPGQIPGLIATALDTRAALRSLLRACRVLV